MKSHEREETRIRQVGTDKKKFRLNTRNGQDGICDCCKENTFVFLTDDGDFCESCIGKMSWLAD